MFLNREELKALTGGKRPVTICRWLDGEGLRYVIARDGWPRVLRSVILIHLGNIGQAGSHEPRLHLS